MFIWSVKSGALKFAAAVTCGLVLLVTLIVLIPTGEKELPVDNQRNYEHAASEEGRIEFLRQFGWEVKPEPLAETKMKVPVEFDRLFTAYNQIQLRQGLDLGKYRRKEVTRYTYEITNFEGHEGQVLANVIVYRDLVVAGDICSASLGDGAFVQGFEKE